MVHPTWKAIGNICDKLKEANPVSTVSVHETNATEILSQLCKAACAHYGTALVLLFLVLFQNNLTNVIIVPIFR